MVTVVLPIAELDKKVILATVEMCKKLSKYPLVVVDKFRTKELEEIATVYINSHADLPEARKIGYSHVETEYTLNLDAGTFLPEDYVEVALALLEENPQVGAVALDFKKLQGHLAFGTSVWRTELLKRLYDWRRGTEVCECIHMWRRLRQAGYLIETLPLRADRVRDNA